MSRKLALGIGAVVVLAIYGVAVGILVTTTGANSIPTPGKAVVCGMIAMFSALLVFVLGFIQIATVNE